MPRHCPPPLLTNIVDLGNTQDHSPTRSRTVHYLLTHLTTLPSQPGLHLCRLGDLSWLLLLATLILGLYSAHRILVPPLATTPATYYFSFWGFVPFLFAPVRVFTFLARFPFLLAFALLAFPPCGPSLAQSELAQRSEVPQGAQGHRRFAVLKSTPSSSRSVGCVSRCRAEITFRTSPTTVVLSPLPRARW